MLTEMLKKLFYLGCIWLNKIVTFRSSHKQTCPATLLKKRLWCRCFPVNFVKFLGTPFLQNTSGRLLLYVLKKYLLCILSRSHLVQTHHNYLLYYFEVKQIEAVFHRWNFHLPRYEKETPTQVFSWEIFLQNNSGGCFWANPGDLWFIVWKSDALVI